MKKYELNYSGAMAYRNDLYKYYDGQCRSGKWRGMGGYDGWISHFCLDLEMNLYKDVPFLRTLFTFEPYAIGRILLYDSEGYDRTMKKIHKKMETPSSRITNVYCYYTGGGIYVYSAKYGNAFLYGTLDQTIDCISVRGEILFHDDDACASFGWTDEMNAFTGNSSDYDSYYIKPSGIEYPTWKDILNSLKSAELLGEGCVGAEECLRLYNPNLTKRTCEE